MTDEQQPRTGEGISRRDVMKRGAVVGGAMVWTTPVVQTMARPAFAAEGTPAGAISYVAALFSLGGTYYRFKVNGLPNSCSQAMNGDVDCNDEFVECGPKFKLGTCTEHGDYLDRSDAASGLPDGVNVTQCGGDRVVIELPSGADDIKAVVKGGNCCETDQSEFVDISGTTVTFDDCKV